MRFLSYLLAIASGSLSVVMAKDDLQERWQLSLLAGGFSEHLTESQEPPKGYKEYHEAIGLHLEQAGNGFVFGGLGMYFMDSFDEESCLSAATVKWKHTWQNEVFLSAGLGAGYVDTSYYSGMIAAPIFSLGYQRISLDMSYVPKTNSSDEVVMGLVSWKLFEW